MDVSVDRIKNFKSFVYNLFIAGLTFSSFLNIIGMILNPANIIFINGFFYILGIFIYTVVLVEALYSFYA
jgi:predicted transcriptional regulator